ncbi:MAG: HAD-IA family hydrolase [Candidatus Bathyarchaeia archaeon]
MCIPVRDFREVAEKGIADVQTGKVDEITWMRETFEHFGLPPPGFGEVWEKTFDAASFNPALLDIVSKLRIGGYRVAALSNLEPSRAKRLRDQGINSLFDVVIFSCEVGLRKPDISKKGSENLDVYRLTLSRLGLRAEVCLFIDDNTNCVDAAESLGIESILFENAEQLRCELIGKGVAFVE